MAENSFNRDEKLKSRKSIEQLFYHGHTFTSPPLKAFYRCVESNNGLVKVAVAVPKRTIKHAVERNKIKRRIREAYRLNKSLLLQGMQSPGISLEIVFLYQADDTLPYATVQSAMRFLLLKLAEKDSKGFKSII